MTTDAIAVCVRCTCDDLNACPGGCYWLAVDRRNGTGVCSCCKPALKAWRAQRVLTDELSPVQVEPAAGHLTLSPAGAPGRGLSTTTGDSQ